MADPSNERPADQPDARARILKAAQDLLEVKSAQFFRVRDIAARAKVSAALVMRYYGSKEELVFKAIMLGMQTQGAPRVQSWVDAEPTLSPEDFTVRLLRVDLEASASRGRAQTHTLRRRNRMAAHARRHRQELRRTRRRP